MNTLSKNKILSKHKVKHKNKIKYKVKCGEQTYSVPAAERGKKLIVGENHVLAVVDHDFTKSSIISFVDLVASKIPEIQKKKVKFEGIGTQCNVFVSSVFSSIKISIFAGSTPEILLHIIFLS